LLLFGLCLPLAFAGTLGGEEGLAVESSRAGLQVVERNTYPELLLDGRPFFPHAAIFFYYRTPRSRWATTLDLYRQFGINTIDFYVPWNWHQPTPDVVDFDGRTHPGRDLKGLMALLREKKLYAIVRIGPVILNEWRNGGYPDWLLARPEYAMPAVDRLEGRYPPLSSLGARNAEAAAAGWLALPDHLRETERWYRALMAELGPHLASRGGPILFLQLDDDQGNGRTNYAGPKFWEYLDRLASMAASPASGSASVGGEAPFVINPTDMRVPAAGCSPRPFDPPLQPAAAASARPGQALKSPWRHGLGQPRRTQRDPSVAAATSGPQGEGSGTQPIAALGQWYLRDHNRVLPSDRTEMEYFVEQLKTQPCFVPMLSEFQAGWYAPGDDSRPLPVEPASTLLASRLMLGRGLRGLTYFPLQDTLSPPGYEVPWANRFYRWDAPLDFNGQARERTTSVLRNGRLLAALGDKLAPTHLQADLGVVDLTPSLPQASLKPPEIREIAANVQRALRLLAAMGYTGEIVDPENQPASHLLRYRMLLVLLPKTETTAASPTRSGAGVTEQASPSGVSTKTQNALAAYAAGGGNVVFFPAQPLWPAFAAALSKPPASSAVRMRTLSSAFLSWVNPSWSDEEIRQQTAWAQTQSTWKKLLEETRIEPHIVRRAGSGHLIVSQLVSLSPSTKAATRLAPDSPGEAGFGFLSVTNLEDEMETASFSVLDPGKGVGRWLELQEIRVPARDSVLLPLQLPLCVSGDCPERIRSSTLELAGVDRQSRKLSLLFYAPERGVVELELPRKPRRIEADEFDVKFDWDREASVARFTVLRGLAPHLVRWVTISLPYSLKEVPEERKKNYPPPDYQLLNVLQIPLDANRSLIPYPWIVDRAPPADSALSVFVTAHGEMPVSASVTYEGEGEEKRADSAILRPEIPGGLRIELGPTPNVFGRGQLSLRVAKETFQESLRWIQLGQGQTALLPMSLGDELGGDTTEYFLESERLRMVVSPDAGGRAVALMDKASGGNWLSSVGGLRDYFSFYEQPPGTRPERARGIAGLHNRPYRAEILEAGGKDGRGPAAALRLSYFAEDVRPAGASIKKTLRLDPQSPHRAAIEYDVALEKGEPAGIKQSFLSATSIAASDREALRFCWLAPPLAEQDAGKETCRSFQPGESLDLPAPVRALRVHRAKVEDSPWRAEDPLWRRDAGLEIGWEEEAQATIVSKAFSVMLWLRFPPLTPGAGPAHYRIYYSLGKAPTERE
jgi:hypothetical protein